MGIFFERFNFKNKVLNFVVSQTNFIVRNFHNTNLDILNLQIDSENLENIEKNRDKIISQNILTKDLEIWQKAKINYKKNSHNIRIRLKGIFSDHWLDKNELSYKIRVENDSLPLLGARRFVLQSPKTTSFIYEWLFMKALEKERLLNLGLDFIKLEINNTSKGIYALIGQPSEDFLIKNKKKISPIVGFESDLWIKEQIRSTNLEKNGVIRPVNSNEDSYFRASISSIQFEEDEKNLIDEKNLEKAIFLLDSFRNGSLKTSEVFDTDQLSKVMVLRALLGASEFDWLDTKFYYNPDTNYLEPISKEIHVDLNNNYKIYFPTWWIDSSKVRDHYFNNKDFFINTLFEDKIFYEKYLNYLNKFSRGNYYLDLIEENYEEFKNYVNILRLHYSGEKIFLKEQIEITKKRIRDVVDPIQGITVYFKDYQDGILTLSIFNQQRLPIFIRSLDFDDDTKIKVKPEISLIDGQQPFVPMSENILKINCNFLESCKKENIADAKLIFNLMGSDQKRKVGIIPHYHK